MVFVIVYPRLTIQLPMVEVERAVRTLADKLARFLLSYRTTPHTATGCTPAELLMGRRIRTRLDILHPELSAKMSEKTKLGNHTTRRNFLPGDPVMVRDHRDRKFSTIWHGLVY